MGLFGLHSALMLAAGMKMPGIDEFLPEPLLFAGTPFAITRITLIRLVVTAFIVIVLGITAHRAKLIPGRWQGFVEYGMDFVREQIAVPALGEERAARYTSNLTMIFFVIFMFNLAEVVPGLDMPATAAIACPLVFALWSVISYVGAGIRTRGLGGFLKAELFPSGVPWPIYIILAPINLLEVFIVRPFSLTVRLFANMIAGHLILAVCYAGTQFLLLSATPRVLAGASILTLLGGLLMTLFEIFVGGLQAYIFAVLTANYIALSTPEVVSGDAPERVSRRAARAAQIAKNDTAAALATA